MLTIVAHFCWAVTIANHFLLHIYTNFIFTEIDCGEYFSDNFAYLVDSAAYVFWYDSIVSSCFDISDRRSFIGSSLDMFESKYK